MAFEVVAGTALTVGLGGLVSSFWTVTQPADFPWGFPEGVTDRVAFARVGVMHNFSYLEGFIGILTGSAYMVVARVRMGNSTAPETTRPAATRRGPRWISRETDS